MAGNGKSKRRIVLYIVLFVAASYAVLHFAFWSGGDEITGPPAKPAGTGSSSSIPTDRPSDRD